MFKKKKKKSDALSLKINLFKKRKTRRYITLFCFVFFVLMLTFNE